MRLKSVSEFIFHWGKHKMKAMASKKDIFILRPPLYKAYGADEIAKHLLEPWVIFLKPKEPIWSVWSTCFESK